MGEYDVMRVLVADDHAIVRDALQRIASEVAPETTIIECGSFDDALSLAEREGPIDLALIDIHMPGMNGVSTVGAFCRAFPDIKVAVFSGNYSACDIVQAFDCGVKGFIPKAMDLQKVFDAARMIIAGHHYIPSDILTVSHAQKAESAKRRDEPDRILEENGLTLREREVLWLVVDGFTNKVIAKRLDIQEVTVKLHLRRIYRKIGARNRAQAVRLALQQNWLPELAC